jgi:hypothetical protein
MVDPLLEEASQVMLGKRNHEVHTLAAQRAQQALAKRIRLGTQFGQRLTPAASRTSGQGK